ncbi:unnamed protein product [Staurois parvus]|uniref:Uncharacterized protein n=1 Tax=Staurois parvus TaxID=386267 RepID=A0ABN9EXG8_9NEOB|nr:unnamed protein product [Staurois parvus]
MLSVRPCTRPAPRKVILQPWLLLNTRKTPQWVSRIKVEQGRTDNSWGPWAIRDHGAPRRLFKHHSVIARGGLTTHGAPGQ